MSVADTTVTISRRTWLKYGAGGVGLLLVGGVGLGLQATVLRTPTTALKALTVRQYSILAAIADVLCPGAEGLPTATELEVATKVDQLLASMDDGVATEIGMVLALLENAVPGILFDGRFSPLTACAFEDQERVLHRWRTSRFSTRRMGFRAIHGLVMGAYWSDPRVYAFVGYPGPPAWALSGRARPSPSPNGSMHAR